MTTESPTPSPDVHVSEELRAPLSDGLELCYQTYGDPADETVLLVMGLSGPMTWWDDEFCRRLARNGFHVVRYDNRDVGLSGSAEGRVGRLDLVRAFVGAARTSPYSLNDMADDAVGLLDHLGVERAHVVGVSMGGMIVQTLAIRHPGRVASLVSIMSTTGRRTVGWQDPRLLPALLAPRKNTKEGYVASAADFWARTGSPAFPTSREETVAKAAATWDRGLNPAGVLRQMMAILTQADRTRDLRAVTVPAAVVHGTADRMVHVSGGRATANSIRGAELVLVDGMGHDLPEPLFDDVIAVIRRTADRATTEAS